MTNDHVKELAAVRLWRRPIAHELLDLIDAKSATTAIKAIAATVSSSNRFFRCCCFGFAAFAPHKRPVKYLIDVGKLTNGIEPTSSDREGLIRAPE
jgi:hypothetical protein